MAAVMNERCSGLLPTSKLLFGSCLSRAWPEITGGRTLPNAGALNVSTDEIYKMGRVCEHAFHDACDDVNGKQAKALHSRY